MKLHLVLVGVLSACVAAYAHVAPQSASPLCDVLLRDMQRDAEQHVGTRVAYFGSPVMSLRAVQLDGKTTALRAFECKTKEGGLVPGGRFTFAESTIERGAADLKAGTGATM